jgi:hypothetical protein
VLRKQITALLIGASVFLASARADAQQTSEPGVGEARLQDLEARARGRSGCGEPELLAAIALYRAARPGAVLRERLAHSIDGHLFSMMVCRGEIGFPAGPPRPRADRRPTAEEVGTRAQLLLDQARAQAICAEQVEAVTELLTALSRRTGPDLVVLTSLANDEVARLDRCERERALPPEVGRVQIVLEREPPPDPAVRAALDAIVPELRTLYRDALLDAPTLTGRIRVSLARGPDVTGARVQLEHVDGLERPLTLAVLRRLGGLVLPGRGSVRARIQLTP